MSTVVRIRLPVGIGIIMSFSRIAEIIVEGKVLGKTGPSVAPDDTRAILPQPVVLKLLDGLVARLLERYLQLYYTPMQSCFMAGRPQTQADRRLALGPSMVKPHCQC